MYESTNFGWLEDIASSVRPGFSILDGYSLEMTGKDGHALDEASSLLAAETRVSIVFLGNDSNESRLAAAKTVRKLGFCPVPHISARGLSSITEFDSFLAALVSEAAVNEVFVVAGDPQTPLGPYGDSLELIRSGRLGRHGIRKVGIAGYPEGHPSIAPSVIWRALREKLRVLADNGHASEITTQFAFDTQSLLDWLVRLRDSGISEAVKLGVPGPASVKTLLRFASRCGVSASASVLAKYGLTLSKLLTTAGPDAFVAELADRLDPQTHGEVRLHFYPFGGIASTARWIGGFAPELPRR